MDGGGAQAVPDGAEEVRARGLEEHLAQLRDEPDADAGGQPRAEVLHPPQLRRQGQAPLQHPRHHHRQPPRRRRRLRRRREPLAVAALRAHRRRRRRRLHPSFLRRHLRAVRRRARRRQQARAAAPPLHAAPAPLRQREARARELTSRWIHGRLFYDADAMRPASASRLTRLVLEQLQQCKRKQSSHLCPCLLFIPNRQQHLGTTRWIIQDTATTSSAQFTA